MNKGVCPDCPSSQNATDFIFLNNVLLNSSFREGNWGFDRLFKTVTDYQRTEELTGDAFASGEGTAAILLFVSCHSSFP